MMKDRTALFFSLLLTVFCIAYFVSVHAGVLKARAESRAERGVFNKGGEGEYSHDSLTYREGYLRIPLPDEVGEQDISVSDDPYDKMLIIRISGADEEFYKKNFFSGDMTGIEDVKYGYLDGVSAVELKTEGVRVPVTEYVQGSFFVRMDKPHDVFKNVVVIDAGHGGDDKGSVVYGIEESAITHGLAKKLEDSLRSDDTLVYMSAPENYSFSDGERASFASEAEADMLISLHTGADSDTRVTKGVMAEASVDMRGYALRLTGLLSEACEQKDLGLSEERISGIMEYIKVPAIGLKLGYITNKGEAEKLNSTGYQEKAAGVIAEYIKSEILK